MNRLKDDIRYTFFDSKDHRHHVRVLRFLGGFVIRVDGETLNEGQVYETPDKALAALRAVWGSDVRLKAV